MKPKLYIGCSLTHASDALKEMVGVLQESLKEHFEVLSFLGIEAGTSEDVYTHDIVGCIQACDYFVAICDEPSIGLGWELSEAVNRYIPVLGAAHRDATVARLVLGASNHHYHFAFIRYSDIDELEEQIVSHAINVGLLREIVDKS